MPLYSNNDKIGYEANMVGDTKDEYLSIVYHEAPEEVINHCFEEAGQNLTLRQIVEGELEQ